MAVLASIVQQPGDIRDYDIDFRDWFPAGDVVTEVALSVLPLGLTIGYALASPVVKVWVRGGVAGTAYKVTVVAGTNDGRAKEVELKVRIKDY